jgi:SAM-dependent methyltransferase
VLGDQGIGARLGYGFNEPEEGHVWSTFNFGLTMRRNDSSRAVILANFLHSDGVLRAHNSASGGRAYHLRAGMNRIVVSYGEDDPVVHFTVLPRRMLPQDVRELGLMVLAVQTMAEQDGLSDLNEGDPDPWVPAVRTSSDRTLMKHLLESFIGAGFTLAILLEDSSSLYLEVAVCLPPSDRAGETATVFFSVNENLITVPVVLRESDPTGWLRGHLPKIIFRGRIGLSSFRADDGEIMPLDIFLCDETGKERFPLQSIHWRGRGTGGEPSPDNIFRVAGMAGQEWMLLSGATWYVKLCRIYERIMDRSIESCGPILDWGVGCARIARFFSGAVRRRVHGVDIDPVNIEWCRANIPDISFQVTSASPPLPFTDETFDLVYGHSVFTHIGEEDQHEWLRELARVTRRGSLCLMTILAEPSWFVRFYPNHRTPSALAEFLEAGFLDDGSLDVGVDASQPGVYRNVSHTSAYIREVWSEYFEIVSIVPNFADMQSLVIMRRRD